MDIKTIIINVGEAMRYYIKEYLNQDYQLEAMQGLDALVSTQIHEVVHVDSSFEKEMTCSDVARYYFGIGVEECHDYQRIAQQTNRDSLQFLQFSNFHIFWNIKNVKRHSDFHKIILDIDFKKVVQDEIKKMILRESLDSDSLLYALLRGMGYTFESMRVDIPIQLLARPLSNLHLSTRSYVHLKKAGIENIDELKNMIKDNQLCLIRDINKTHIHEIVDHYCQFLQKDYPYHIELNLKQNKSPITLIYETKGFDIEKIVHYFYNDIFPNDQKSLLRNEDAFFGMKITNALLWMGYSHIEDVASHIQTLGQLFYQNHITKQPDDLQKRYHQYLKTHIVFHEIPYSLYHKLKDSHASTEEIKSQLHDYHRYIDEIISRISNKFYYVEKEGVHQRCIQEKHIKAVLDPLEDVCVVMEVVKKLKIKWHDCRIIHDMPECRVS